MTTRVRQGLKPELAGEAATAQHDGTLKYYVEHASEYAEATRALEMDIHVERFMERLEPSSSVLDLGCGSGRDLAVFRRAGHRPVGLDLSPPLANLAAEYSKCPVVVGDVAKLPFARRSFSAVWAAGSLHHLLRHEIEQVLVGIGYILIAGGILFTSVKLGEDEGPDHLGRWFTYFQTDEWTGLLTRSGFEVLTVATETVQSGPNEQGRGVTWISCISRWG